MFAITASMQPADALGSMQQIHGSIKAVPWRHTSCSKSDQQIHGTPRVRSANACTCRQPEEQQNYGIMSGSYPAAVQAVVLKIQAVVLKPSKIMFTCSWA